MLYTTNWLLNIKDSFLLISLSDLCFFNSKYWSVGMVLSKNRHLHKPKFVSFFARSFRATDEMQFFPLFVIVFRVGLNLTTERGGFLSRILNVG